MCFRGTKVPAEDVSLASQKQYLFGIKVPVPSSKHNETRQISSTVSYPWQKSKARSAGELSLTLLGVRSNFTFAT